MNQSLETRKAIAAAALDEAFAEKDNCKSWEYVAIAIGGHLETIRAALQPAQSAWLPISEAPKTWNPILACGFTEDGQPVPIVAHWDSGEWKEYSTKQWLTSLTHFMPLPAPPTQNATRDYDKVAQISFATKDATEEDIKAVEEAVYGHAPAMDKDVEEAIERLNPASSYRYNNDDEDNPLMADDVLILIRACQERK